jgi:hypothetical protein
MTKELHEILKRMMVNLMYKHSVTLTAKELSLVMRYIHELEREISGGDEED